MIDVPETQIEAVFSPVRKRSRRVICHVGTDIRLSTKHLEAYCFRELDDRDRELVYLAGVVAYADRFVRRHRSEGWRRRIHIVMPVGTPQAWQDESVVKPLRDTLAFITGDVWTFEFTLRSGSLPRLNQPELNLGHAETVVVPFSNGLDSFAQSRLLRIDGFLGDPIRITAKTRAIGGDHRWLVDSDGVRFRRVSIPFTIETTAHPEPSYRTRSFVFATMAGLAAKLAGSKCVVVPEAGQGTFGPSLVPVGSESPHRGSHPGFTRRMTALLKSLWGTLIRFEHPQMWRTKGEVLRRLDSHQLLSGWQATHSCSQGPRQIRTERHIALHCGLCAGCLLRRVSVFAAGLRDDHDQYFFANLGASDLKESVCRDAARNLTRNDVDIAAHAVLAMQSLADLANNRDIAARKVGIFDAFEADELNHVQNQLDRMLIAHRDEWRGFLASLPVNSWINRVANNL